MSLLTDGKLAQTIAQALGNVMGTLTLSRTTEGTYNPATGGVGEGTTTIYSVKGMLEDFDSMTLQKAQSFLDGSIIKAGDRKATILAHGLAITPEPGDTITADGKTHMVVAVSSDPAGATYSLQIRA